MDRLANEAVIRCKVVEQTYRRLGEKLMSMQPNALAALCLTAGLLAACDGVGLGGAGQAKPELAEAVVQLPDIGASVAPAAGGRFDGEIEAVGVEPFWTLTLLPDWVSFSRGNLQTIQALPEQREYGAHGMRLKAGQLLIALTDTPCRHPSGETYDLTAAVRFENVLYEGCARPLPADRVAASWVSFLPDLLPAIDACLARANARPAQVTIAYLNDGVSAVRLIEADGGRYECGVTATGAVSYYFTLGDRDQLSGEGEPLFTRAPQTAPEGECLVSEPAPGDVGWFTRRVC